MDDMFFYDTDLQQQVDSRQKSRSLTDEEHTQRRKMYDELLSDYKKRVRLAMGYREARNLEKYAEYYISRDSFTDMGNEAWKSMFAAVLRACCMNMISAKIKFTPNKYRYKCSAEQIARIIKICGLDERTFHSFFEEASLDCEASYGQACMDNEIPSESLVSFV